MNHQRGRRFKSAKSSAETSKNFAATGLTKESEGFRSTSISPGTEFMNDLNDAIAFLITQKMKEDENWRKMKIIFSGANVPGEGEHKIMDFIRANKKQFVESDSHCVYSSDADMILLTLVSGLKNVMLMRDPIAFRPSILKSTKRNLPLQHYEVIHITLLREYMAIEFGSLQELFTKIKFDINRVLDDFLALCNFVGNDFLPRLYTFQIRTGRFDTLLDCFKEFLINTDSYISDGGKINFVALRSLIELIAPKEMEFLNCKLKDVQKYLGFLKATKGKQPRNTKEKGLKQNLDEVGGINSDSDSDTEVPNNQIPSEFFQAKQIEVLSREVNYLEKFIAYSQRKDNFEDGLNDSKAFYYKEKLEIDLEQPGASEIIKDMCMTYLEGIQFVLFYYHKGVPSWNWNYNYHYSPMLTDVLAVMKSSDFSSNFVFEESKPFDPFKQLLLILHPDDSVLLPHCFQDIVRNSALRIPVDYYPIDFEIDPFGGVFDSEFIAIIPFVPQNLLNNVYDSIDKSVLTLREQKRNSVYPISFFEFDAKLKPSLVQSFIPKVFSDFSLTYRKTEYLKEIPKLSSPTQAELEDQPANFIKFPTFFTITGLRGQIEQVKKKNGNHDSVFISLPNNPRDPAFFENSFTEDFQDLLDRDVYIDYPHQYHGTIMAVLTPAKAFCNTAPKLFDTFSSSDYHSAFSKAVLECSRKFGEKNLKCRHKIQTILVIAEYNYFAKNRDGSIFSDYAETLYPIELVSFTKEVRYKSDLFTPKSLDKEFEIDSPVLVLGGEWAGSLGHVKYNCPPKSNSSEKNNSMKFFLPTVTIDKAADYNFDKKIMTTLQSEEKNSEYYSISFLMNKLDLEKSILVCLLENLIVTVDSKSESSIFIPKKIELGLNIIDLMKFRVVAELVHLRNLKRPMKDKPITKETFLNSLEINKSVLDTLTEFIKTFPELISILKVKVNSNHSLKAADIYPTLEDPNLGVLKIYEWLIKKKISFLYFRTPWTKTLPLENYELLEKIINEKISIPTGKHADIKEDPNYYFPLPKGMYLHPFYQIHPAMHEIGDQVFNLNTTNDIYVPFGLSGYVVGVLGRNNIEVVFDETFIGGSTLGGKCSKSRGVVVGYLDVFNVNSINSIGLRYSKSRDFAWDGYVNTFIPKFMNQSISYEEPEESNDKKSKDNKGSKSRIEEEEVKNDPKIIKTDSKMSGISSNSTKERVGQEEFKSKHTKTKNDKKFKEKKEKAQPQTRPIATAEMIEKNIRDPIQPNPISVSKLLNPSTNDLKNMLNIGEKEVATESNPEISGDKKKKSKKMKPLKKNSQEFAPKSDKNLN